MNLVPLNTTNSGGDLTMVSSEKLTMYHPVVGDIDDIVLGPENFHRLRVTKPLNDFFVTGSGFTDLRDTPGFFPIVYFYRRLLEHTQHCFGNVQFNGFGIYNFDDISRLGLEFYIYYILDYTTTTSTVQDISVFALFVVSRKNNTCEIWNLCKNVESRSKVGQEFLNAAMADARLTFDIRLFWLGISFVNSQETVGKLFELYHTLGFTEPLLTNMSLFGKDTGIPLLELVLYPGVFDDSTYTRTLFAYFVYLFYEEKSILFTTLEFPTKFGAVDKRNVAVHQLPDRELLPSEHTTKGVLSRTFNKLQRKPTSGGASTKQFEKKLSLSDIHKALVIDTPVEVGGTIQFSKVSPVYTKLVGVGSLESTLEVSAVSGMSKFGPLSFHSHPLFTIESVYGYALGWPSTPDISTCMFNAVNQVLVHFVFTSEGLYLIKNNYLFLTFQNEFGRLFGKEELENFYNSYRIIVLGITRFLEEMRKKDAVLPLGLIQHTRDNWIGYMNSLTISELLPGSFVPRITDQRQQYTAEMVQAVSAVNPDFGAAIEYMEDFQDEMQEGFTSEKQFYYATKMLRLPLFNLDFIPSELLSTHKTTSVLFSSFLEGFN